MEVINVIDENFEPSCNFEKYMKNIILKKGVNGLPQPSSRMEVLLWELCVQLSESGSGSDGKSAYDLAVQQGYVGTLDDWLLTLVGPRGPKGDTGSTGKTGPTGEPGKTPVRGVDYWTEADIAEIKSYIDSKIAESQQPQA